ncbi:hypothetical protein K9M78_07560 [Candidatus Bipolaricaulota bacterium]|nr:hypothetical protein [Candidatus Bipolaricaulota bacterium]
MLNQEDLPKQIINSSTATVSVSSRRRKKKFSRLLEVSRSGKVSGAIWEAIDFYLKSKQD